MNGEVWLALALGLAAGGTVAWLLAGSRRRAEVAERATEAEATLGRMAERAAAAEAGLQRLEADLASAREELSQLRGRLDEERSRHAAGESALREKLGATQTLLEAERTQSTEKLKLLEAAREELANRFKALANDILEEKSKRFTEQNQANLGALLEPLKSRLQEFQGKVEQVYVAEGKDRTALAEQVKQLMALNQQLSSDAHALTSALRGQAKTQGNWGEVILDRVLEASGLVKGLHYEAQARLVNEEGRTSMPDVVIRLPESRDLVVDAKVALNAYQDYCAAEDRDAQDEALKRHLEAIRAHIKGLSGKNYQQLPGLKAPDFVLMFVPVEPAFIAAIANDANLWRDAWDRNVLLVSPSTLLFVLRTVAQLWRQEQQSNNAREIARRGAELYDKLVSFVADLQEVGQRMEQASKSYENAMSKLARGRGNAIRQAEMLRELGVKPAKSLPQKLLEDAQDAQDLHAVDQAAAVPPKRVA